MIRLLGKQPTPLNCPTCEGKGRRITHDAIVGKGWVVKGLRCATCKGHGTLPTR
ncbi:hypothetical protein AB0M44_23995 [Streptosporangium subroseum]|uniref:hypothetical protein n=1 Tax=Streptosporangium subroseum TaxID=106412 RepID=UPI00343272BC